MTARCINMMKFKKNEYSEKYIKSLKFVLLLGAIGIVCASVCVVLFNIPNTILTLWIIMMTVFIENLHYNGKKVQKGFREK